MPSHLSFFGDVCRSLASILIGATSGTIPGSYRADGVPMLASCHVSLLVRRCTGCQPAKSCPASCYPKPGPHHGSACDGGGPAGAPRTPHHSREPADGGPRHPPGLPGSGETNPGPDRAPPLASRSRRTPAHRSRSSPPPGRSRAAAGYRPSAPITQRQMTALTYSVREALSGCLTFSFSCLSSFRDFALARAASGACLGLGLL